MEIRGLDVNFNAIEDEGKMIVTGIVNKPGEQSEVLYSRGKKFVEVIDKGVFAKAIAKASKIDYLSSHDPNRILASTANGSMTIEETDEGVVMKAEIVNTSYGRDAYNLIKSGLIQGMSFGFIAKEETWGKTDEGINLRTIKDMEIFEVSSLRTPAYNQSSISARGLSTDDINVPDDEPVTPQSTNQIEYREGDKVIGGIEKRELGQGAFDVFIHGAIGSSEWDKLFDDSVVIPKDVLDMFEDMKGASTINLHLNSPGGSVFNGLAIVNALKSTGAKTVSYVEGNAGSITSVIAFACDETNMYNGTFTLLHKPLLSVTGNAYDLKKAIQTLDVIQEGIIDVYMTKVKDGVERSQIEKIVNKETWLTAEMASELFNINIIDKCKEKDERGLIKEVLDTLEKRSHEEPKADGEVVEEVEEPKEVIEDDPKKEEIRGQEPNEELMAKIKAMQDNMLKYKEEIE